MAVPAVLDTYPADEDTGIPVGSVLYVDFDRGVDTSTCRNSVVLYGADTDTASGPNGAIWINQTQGTNPQYLHSPGFKGLAEVDLQLVYVDQDTGEELALEDVENEAYELAYGTAGAIHRLKITPRQQLAADTEYVLHIMGDPDSQGNGISSRTVFDVLPDVGNGDSGIVEVYGGYVRSQTDRVIITIQTAGAINTSTYSWYYENEGPSTARTGCVTSRRYRRLEDGLQIRFSGSGFVQGDIYRVRVEPIERLEESYRVTFTTNDGSYSEAPDSPSTPATSEPPSSILPASPTEPLGDTTMSIVACEPPNGAYQMNKNVREFTITFSDQLDPATITADTVRVYKYPVSGIFNGTRNIIELAKVLTVNGDVLTIKI